ncbi:MAG: MMPL family transporter [Solobacterium sp.]|jgi:predicted RND superfamily exporter protein|nr:MMPL family transporter [Solobacterium sp.]MCH4221942.1 MMPL family transporter [Solobacterium sp.]MCH4265547.1 MMPL family transporter [Solobacterium sp.]
MKKFSHWIVKHRVLVLILAVVLAIPSYFMYIHTRVNYDMLSYLPGNIDTMKGQDILENEFGSGAFSMLIVEGMPDKDVSALKTKVEAVDHVKTVIWYDSLADISMPKEMLPEKVYNAFNKGDATMMLVIYDDTSSADNTMDAVANIRKIAGKQCFLTGTTPVVLDTKNLADQEAPVYVGLAVLLSAIALSCCMDSFLIPFIFLASIGFAIIYNLGTNMFLGSISYITKAIAAVLQLGVTMDYSIFLWNSYMERRESGKSPEDAMAKAIELTFSSIAGSSTTTIAGFIALCFMSFALGKDLGIVMSKGVLFGLISCITILPSMILVFHKPLEKTKHKPLLPDIGKLAPFIIKHYKALLAIFILLMVPSIYGYKNYKTYYNLDSSLPKDMEGIVANEKLQDEFDMNSIHLLMLSSDVPDKDVRTLASQMESVDGVNWVIGLNTIKGESVPEEVIPDEIKNAAEDENWQLILIGSKYQVASDEVNQQVTELQSLAKNYDSSSMLIGEAPCTKDLIDITAKDFTSVDSASIGIIFAIILLVFGSVSIPIVLVSVIELSIFINMGICYYTNTTLPFIAGIVISTVQLGSCVDYAILMTNRYLFERRSGKDKKEAMTIASSTCSKSILVSSLSFFAATYGVGIYSTIDMISALCKLMARGALLSMACVIFILPAFLLVFDKFIMAWTWKGRLKKKVKAKIADHQSAQTEE